MKKQQIKQLALSIVETGEISQSVYDWINKNLSKSELKLFVNYLESALKASIVTIRYAGNPSQATKDKIKKNVSRQKSCLCKRRQRNRCGNKI